MLKNIFTPLLLVACIFSGKLAIANPITDLYNTGVDNFGVVLPSDTQGDSHYSLVSNSSYTPIFNGQIRVESSAYGYPIVPNNWMGDNSTSRWIATYDPSHPGALYAPVGYFDYRTTFTLSSEFDPRTATILGQWAVDNEGVQILLNGVDTKVAQVGIPGSSPYDRWTTFVIASGIQTGTNTLDFIVHNDSGPSGLRVEMVGSAFPVSAVPEPATYALMIIGLGFVGAALSRNLIKTDRI